MVNEILPGYVSRVGHELAIRQFDRDIKSVLSHDFAAAGANIIKISSELVEIYAHNEELFPDIKAHILESVTKLKDSRDPLVRETADKINQAMTSSMPQLRI